jgi:hypothetical protein
VKAEDLESTTIYNYRVIQGGRARGGKAGTGLGVTSVDMGLARLKTP